MEVVEKSKFTDTLAAVAMIGVLAGAIIGGIVGLVTEKGLLGKIGGLIGGAIKFGAIALAGSFFVSIIVWLVERSRENSADDELRNKYYKNLDNDKKRVENELQQAKKLETMKNELVAQHNQTLSFLKRYYEAGNIYPSYQNLNAVCSFYEYFASGICTELGGSSGAYNTYREDVRWGKLLDKMDQVIKNLEQIKTNQHTLYDAINDGNSLTRNLLNESVRQTQLQSFSATSNAITAYNSQCSLEEQRWNNFLKTYDLMTTGR